jgi:hypothetical protein
MLSSYSCYLRSGLTVFLPSDLRWDLASLTFSPTPLTSFGFVCLLLPIRVRAMLSLLDVSKPELLSLVS